MRCAHLGRACYSYRRGVVGDPDPDPSTSHVERQHLTMRMSMRRFTRLTNAFSKKIDNHTHMLSLYFVFHNFCRVHKSIKTTPAVNVGISDTAKNLEWMVALLDENRPEPKKRGPYKKKTARENSKRYTTDSAPILDAPAAANGLASPGMRQARARGRVCVRRPAPDSRRRA